MESNQKKLGHILLAMNAELSVKSGLVEKSMRINLIWAYILANCQLVYLHHMIKIRVFLRTEPLIILLFSFRSLRRLYMDMKAGGVRLSQQMTLPEYQMQILKTHGMLAY